MNNIEAITKNWKQILIWVVLLFGLAISVYLVQTRQIFRSRASSNINDGLKVTDDAGNDLYIGNNTYQTIEDHVNVSIKNLQELTSP